MIEVDPTRAYEIYFESIFMGKQETSAKQFHIIESEAMKKILRS